MKKNKSQQFKKTALISALLLEMSSAALAGTIVVDGTTCILHDAITAANDDAITGGCSAGSGADELVLPVNADMVLMSALPIIYRDISINGNQSTIRRDTGAVDFPVLRVENTDLTLNDVTISNGVSATSSNLGGGIYGFYANVSINSSEISNNTGGAIHVYSSQLNMTDSIVTNNQGFPSASSGSAGITLKGSDADVVRSTISGNQTFGGGKGGAMYLSNSYFYGSNVVVSNSTISGNSSESGGGGVHINETFYYYNPSSAVLTLSHVTVTNNSSNDDAGAVVVEDGNLILNKTLVAGNQGSLVNEILKLDGSVVTDGFNLFGLAGSSGSVGVKLGATDAVIAEADISLVLNPVLGDNGGLTPSHLLSPGSPAIDFVPNLACDFVDDQAGNLRPIDGDSDGTADCDVGALEYRDVIFKNGFE